MASQNPQTQPAKLLDDLVVKRPGPGVRAISIVMPGVRKVSDQVPPYTKWWSDQNHELVDRLQANQTGGAATHKLLVSIGDSSALGIGAKAPELSYIGQLTTLLSQRAAERSKAGDSPATWNAINLSMSGARVRDGIDRQLPLLHRLENAGLKPDLVVCVIGSNDVFWGSGRRRQSATQRNAKLRQELTELIELLPTTAVVGEAAGKSERGQLANQAIRAACQEHNLPSINPWKGESSDPRPRLAEDRFHLNEIGYAVMAENFLNAIDSNATHQ